MLPIGVLISGRGSNLQAILDAIGNKTLEAEVRLVISNKRDAEGLLRAQRSGVPCRVVPHQDYPDRAAFEGELVTSLKEAGAEWIVLAGFMRVLTPIFLNAFRNRVINIHPSLLPAFPGVDAQGQALKEGARITGCTVHVVDAGTDTGPIIAQAPVQILEGDTRETLSARVLIEEHRLLVDVLRSISEGLLTVVEKQGERTRITLTPPPRETDPA